MATDNEDSEYEPSDVEIKDLRKRSRAAPKARSSKRRAPAKDPPPQSEQDDEEAEPDQPEIKTAGRRTRSKTAPKATLKTAAKTTPKTAAKTTPKTAPKTAPKARAASKRTPAKNPPPGASPISDNSFEGLGLDKLAVDIDMIGDSTPILKRLWQNINKYDIRAATGTIEYTPNLNVLEHVLDLPPFDPTNRRYKLLEEEIALYEHEMWDGGKVQAWRLAAINEADPSARAVQLFVMPISIANGMFCPPCRLTNNNECGLGRGSAPCNPCKKKNRAAECIRTTALLRDHGPNIITEAICGESERDKVKQLGQMKVDIMNRVPLTLDVDSWWQVHVTAGRAPASPIRAFIDITALIEWKKKYNPTIDLGDLGFHSQGEQKSVWSKAYYPPGTVPVYSEFGIILAAQPAIWAHKPPPDKISDKNLRHNVKLNIPFENIDIPRAFALEDLSSYHIFKTERRDDKDDRVKAASRIMEWICFQMVGRIGTVVACRNFYEDVRRTFMSVAQAEQGGVSKARGQRGPYKGGLIWARPTFLKGTKRVKILPIKTVVGDLLADDCPALHTQISILTALRDPICHAYIMQQSLDAIARGDSNLLKVLVAAHVVAEYVELGLVTKDAITDTYCSCKDTKEQALTEHHCMTCYTVRPCINMVVRATKDGVIRECTGCSTWDFDLTPRYWNRYTMKDVIKARVYSIFYYDRLVYKPPFTQAELRDVLIKQNTLENAPTTWFDDYQGRYVDLAEATYPSTAEVPLRLSGKHPYAPSVEKPYSHFLREDGTVSLHDIGNLVMTMDCINRAKYVGAASVLVLLKNLLQLQTRVAHLPPRTGYYPEVAEEMAIIERAFDNQRMIDILTPLSNAGRVNVAPDKEYFSRVHAMQRSGIWDETSLPEVSNRLKLAFVLRGEVYILSSYKYSTEWSDEEWNSILHVISQIENDTGPNGFNKHKMDPLPRMGSDGTPWPWRKDTCPTDWNRHLCYREFRARLHTMDTGCDPHHVTDESPASLLIEYVVQHFENGGKCHFYGTVFTAYSGHLATYSFGRGVYQDLGQGRRRLIKPGERMQSGCKVLFPVDIFTDYDITRRTIVVESWPANHIRFCYPPHKNLIRDLQNAVRGVQDETNFYYSMGELGDYPRVPLPKSYKDKRAWMASLKKTSFDKRKLAASLKKGLGDFEYDSDVTSSSESDHFDFQSESGSDDHDIDLEDPEVMAFAAIQDQLQSLKEDRVEEPTPAVEPVVELLQTADAIDSWKEQGDEFVAALAETQPDFADQMRKWMEVGVMSLKNTTANGPPAVPQPVGNGRAKSASVLSTENIETDGMKLAQGYNELLEHSRSHPRLSLDEAVQQHLREADDAHSKHDWKKFQVASAAYHTTVEGLEEDEM
ncbi:hypothetical protein NX059_010690 [Plenodomus lindquistii]|nr:hypothetical protein NX059_010690 [Plenodomus lindquistii]